jgi:peroxiredoxin
MDQSGGNLLQRAETLLREGNRQAALPLLAEYLKERPNSARGWWMLSLAVTDPRQQIECMERVLLIDPNYAPARARLEKLEQNPVFRPPSVSPFLAESSPRPKASPPIAAPAPRPAPSTFEEKRAPELPRPAAPRPIPAKKKSEWIMPAALGSLFLCAMLGVFGVFLLMNFQPVQVAAAQPFITVPPQTMPPTWTPTFTVTPRPSMTPFASQTPLPPVILLDSDEYATAVQDVGVGPSVGKFAPDFTLKNLEGNSVSLSSQRGHPVVLFFWATWCPYCEHEIPVLEDFHKNLKDEGLVILTVDVGESSAQAREYRASHDLTLPILNDSGENIFRLYGGRAFPTNYFIDVNGRVVSVTVGMMEYDVLNLQIRALLGLIPTSQ